MAEATPRPWYVGTKGNVWAVRAMDVVAVCAPVASDRAVTNAALIVEAVNSHDAYRALLEAAEEAAARCSQCHGRGSFSPHCYRCDDSTWDHDDCPPDVVCGKCAALRAAIAAVKGEGNG